MQRLGDGYSASHIAIDNDDKECLQVCLEAKADSEVRNYKGETPQQLAYLCGSHRMVELCQKFGAGEYQLEYAETEPVLADEEEDMETEVSLRFCFTHLKHTENIMKTYRKHTAIYCYILLTYRTYMKILD